MKNKLVLYTAAAVLLLPITTALASGPPDTKEGLWSMDRQTIDNPGNKKKVWPPIKICRNHAFDQYLLQLAKGLPGCTTLSETTQGNKYSIETSCTVEKSVLVTRSTATYQGDTSIHSESHTVYTPALYGTSETTMISDSQYIGSCPASMQPGDRTNPDGSISHGWKH